MTTLDIGDVLSTTAKVVASAFLQLLIIAAVCLSPTLLIGIVVGYFAASAENITPEQIEGLVQSPGVLAGLLGGGTAVWIVTVLLTLVSQGAMLHATIEFLSGRSPSAGASLRVALGRLLPILGASFLVGLVVLLGTLACIVPGIILAIMYYVAIPAVVAEGIGGAQSLSRSAELTQGNRWYIFATLLVIGVIMIAFGFATGLVQAPFNLMAKQAPVIAIIPAVIQYGQQVLTTIVSSVLVGVIYVRLRGLREGVDVQSLANVFA